MHPSAKNSERRHQERPAWRAVWKAGADAKSRRALLALYCWRYHGVPGRHLLRRILLPRGSPLHLNLRLGSGVRMALRPEDRGDHASLFENFFEVVPPASLCREPRLIVDAGAHIGCFSVLAHAHWPQARLVAFEPDAGNVALLSDNFRLNQIQGDIVPMALWREPALLDFAFAQSNSGYLTAGTKHDAVNAATTIPVKATSLSAFFCDDLASIDLLKLDIEGAELEVLVTELPRLSSHTVILCELHFAQTHQARFLEILTSSGWQAELYNATHPPHSTWIIRHP